MHWNLYFFRSKSCIFNAFSTEKSWKCNELITSLRVIGNMKNRIFCYEKTIETIKTRKNVFKTERFNTFLWDFVFQLRSKSCFLCTFTYPFGRREAASFGTWSFFSLIERGAGRAGATPVLVVRSLKQSLKHEFE